MISLYHSDCLAKMPDIPDNSIDLILCDLPYGTTQCKWDAVIPFKLLWEEYKRIIKENGAIVLFSAQPFTTKLISSNMKDYRYNWYWLKNTATGGMFSKVQPMRCVEDICVFYKHKPTYNPQGLLKLKKPIVNKENRKTELYNWQGKKQVLQTHTNYPKHVLQFDSVPTTERVHSTQKPVRLLEYLIKTYTNPGDIVLDNCMGSGSTGVAAVNLGRSFVGIEKEKKYFDIALKRIFTENAKIDMNDEKIAA